MSRPRPAAAARPRSADRRPGVQAVVFDLDGVLVDSEPLWTRAEEELAARLDRTWTPQIKAAVVGTRLDISVPRMLRLMGSDADPTTVAAGLLDRMCELFDAELALRPGSGALLDQLGAAGVPLGLVSSSLRRLVDAALPLLGSDRFAVTVAGDEVDRPKPDPQPYRLAVARLGADPARCVVFEDTPTGVAAAESAGCVCVGVAGVVPVAPAPRRPVLRSLAEVDLGWIDRLVAAATLDRDGDAAKWSSHSL